MMYKRCCSTAFSYLTRTTALAVAFFFLWSQMVWAAPPAFLRPLAVEEREAPGQLMMYPESVKTRHPEGVTHRRGFLGTVAAGAAAMLFGAGLVDNTASAPIVSKTQQEALAPVPSPAAFSPLAKFLPEMRERQTAMLKRHGETIRSQNNQTHSRYNDPKYVEMLVRRGYMTRASLTDKTPQILGPIGEIAKLQQDILLGLASYLRAKDNEARSTAWTNLTESVDRCLASEIEYWEGKAQEESRRIKRAFWAKKDIEPEARLAQAWELREIYKNLRLINCPLLLFKMIPLGNEVNGILDTLPPAVNPDYAPREGRDKAFDLIKASLKKILKEEIGIIEQKKSGNEEEYYERAKVADAQIDILREQIARVDKIQVGQRNLELQAFSQLGAIVGLWDTRLVDASKDIESTKRLLTGVLREKPKSPSREYASGRFSGGGMEILGTALIRELFIASLEGLQINEKFNLEVVKMLQECNKITQDMNSHYRALGYAVPFPRTLEPERGFLDFQQFVPPQAIPLKSPPAPDEIKNHSEGIKSCHTRYLGLRAHLKEMLAQARRGEASERAINTHIQVQGQIRVTGTGRDGLYHLMDIAREDEEDEKNLAGIDELAAKSLRAEIEVANTKEGTDENHKARAAHDGAVMAVLRKMRQRSEIRIKQLSKRGFETDRQLYYEKKELESIRDQLNDKIDLYELILKAGGHLGSVDFPPSAVYSMEGILRAASGDVRRPKFHGYIEDIGEDGKPELAGVFEGGVMPAGLVGYEDSCNGRYGENVVHEEVKGGVAASSGITKVFCDRAGILFNSDNANSIGFAYAETGNPQLDLQLSSGEYNIIGLEGFYTISSNSKSLGLDPRDTSKYLFGRILFKVSAETLQLKDGRIVKRYTLIPKRLVVFSTSDILGREIPSKNITTQGEPVLDVAVYDIEHGETVPIETSAGKMNVSIKKSYDRARQRYSYEIERQPDADRGKTKPAGKPESLEEMLLGPSKEKAIQRSI